MKKIYTSFLLTIFIVIPLLNLYPFSADTTLPSKNKTPVIRVKVASINNGIILEGTGLSWKTSGRVKKSNSVNLMSGKNGITLNGKMVKLPVHINSNNPISVGGKKYRGDLIVAPGSQGTLINVIDVESYTAGVINQEIDSRWPEAAVDAQTILIRTYALKRADERAHKEYDLDSTVTDQVYGGFDSEDDLAWASVKRTKGLVLTYKGQLATGLYHSVCGGKTELPSLVWGGQDKPYYQSVNCDFCMDAPRYFWRSPENGVISRKEIAGILGIQGQVKEITVTERTASGRAKQVEVSTNYKKRVYSGLEFRKLMGYSIIFSNSFQVETLKNGFVFRGSGSGHGAGMCQWGAKGMAEEGYQAHAILEYYFPGTKVQNLDQTK